MVLIALFVSAIWIVVLALQSDTSAYYQICETNQYTDKERCTPHHILYVAAWYIGYWFNASSAILTAFATLAIAWFTIILTRVGGKQAKIFDDQKRLQRAYIFGGCGVTGLVVNLMGQVRTPALSPRGFPQVKFQPGYRNYGQTPAFCMQTRLFARRPCHQSQITEVERGSFSVIRCAPTANS